MSFRLRTILGIALIESILLLILVISSLDFLRSSNEDQLLQRAATTSKLFASATKNALLSTDLATLETFVEGILTNPEVVYVRIVADRQVLAQGGPEALLTGQRTPDFGLDSVADDVFDVIAPIEEAGITYGSIELGLSTQNLENVFAQARQWAISIAVIEVLLVAVFSWMLGAYLTRHLLQLRTASKSIADSGPGHQVEVSGTDEIADVAKAFNAMSLSLQTTYSELTDSLQARERMLVSLERSKAKSQAILSSSLDAIITIAQDGTVIDFNPAAERIFGWSLGEILGHPLAEHIIPPELREAHDRGMQHYLNTGEGPVLGARIQLEAMHKDGRRFPVEAAICPIDTPEGKLFTAFLRDISKQLADETEMRLIGQAFQTSEAMFIADADATIVRVNEAFTRISGYREDEVLGRKPSIWASGTHDADFYRQMWQSLLQRGEWKGEIQNRRKNGEVFPEYLNISAVRDPQGNISHYVAHLVDISEQKASEQRLLTAMQQAKRADEAKSRFLAVMSHEIRTPMNAVLGVLGLMRDTPLNENQQDLIRTGRESGEMLLSIINDILDFSKMEADKLELESTSFDLHRILQQSVDLLRHRAQQHDLELKLEVAPDLPRFVRGDSSRLQQVLVNLINNACKFTASGSVTVRARSSAQADNGFRLHCEVEDSGIGIPRERQNELFEEFSMVDQTHSRAYEGTGLGLAICKRLVSLMGGQIAVDSQPGIGSRFYFDVILKDARADEIEPTQDLQSFELPSPHTRILLAEDNPANQRVIRAILRSADLEVDLASNGIEVVEAVSSLPYDIVLMDISMPQMDGMEATRTIRELDGPASQVPIVALTAHALKGDRERFIASGMNDYLTKPIDKAATLRCIQRWTGEKKSKRVEPGKTGPTMAMPKPTDDSSEPSCVDEGVLRQLVRDTSAQIVPELLLGYIEDTRDRLPRIEASAAGADFAALELEVHTLGSSAGAHGNTALLKLARQVETACRDGDRESALEQVPGLLELADRSLQQLAERAARGFD